MQGAELARPSNDPATRTDVLVLFRVRMDRDGYGEEYMVVPLLSRRDATDDVEVVVLDDAGREKPVFANFWRAVPIRLRGVDARGVMQPRYAESFALDVTSPKGAWARARCARCSYMTPRSGARGL